MPPALRSPRRDVKIIVGLQPREAPMPSLALPEPQQRLLHCVSSGPHHAITITISPKVLMAAINISYVCDLVTTLITDHYSFK